MSTVYKFSDFVLNKNTITFYRRNVPVQLSSRAFEMLLYLIEKRGEIVEKDALLNRVWRDAFVEEANLAVHISALRRVLQEKKGEARFIRTISGRGYSFIGDVEVIDESHLSQTVASREHVDEKTILSIAVLPFSIRNSNEDNEYLANGITQSLIGDLSRRTDLRVLSYSAVKAYKDSGLEIQEIGFLLDAEKIVSGMITDFKGHWEISVELINAKDKRCLWATNQSFSAADIFEVKKEISSVIADKLHLSLGSRKTEESNEIDSEAQKLYYRGKFILEARSTRKRLNEVLSQALKFFNDAILREPKFSLAYTGIGSVYVSLYNHNLLAREVAYAEAKKALTLALASDEQLSEALVLKASIEVMFELDCQSALETIDRAIRLNPSNPDCYHWKSLICLSTGNFETALFEEEKAVKLDPTSIRFNGSLLRIFFHLGDFNRVIVLADELLEFDNSLPTSYFFSALAHAHLGSFKDAIANIDLALNIREAPDVALHKVYILAMAGLRLEAESLLDEILGTFEPHELDKIDIAVAFSELRQFDSALRYLKLAAAEKSSGLITLKFDPRLRAVRETGEFSQLLASLNLR